MVTQDAITPPATVTKQVTDTPDKNGDDKTTSANTHHHKHHKRTLGLHIFDTLVYPIVNNIGVFVVSVYATYLTSRGGDKNAAGELLHGKKGEFFQKRGTWLVGKFKGMGMSDKTADMSKMVFFSFADGSILAPLVKLLEDRREKIGRWLDDKFGTTPDDKTVYSDEPKQSWTSVLSGRAGTALIVVNTAVALEKTGFNDKLFHAPGKAIGERLKGNVKVQEFFGKYDVGELAKISIFEAFYTSVCTAGLYFSSRAVARHLNDREEKREVKKGIHAHVHKGEVYISKTGASEKTSNFTSAIPAATANTTQWADNKVSALDKNSSWANDKVAEIKKQKSWADEQVRRVTAVPKADPSYVASVDAARNKANSQQPLTV